MSIGGFSILCIPWVLVSQWSVTSLIGRDRKPSQQTELVRVQFSWLTSFVKNSISFISCLFYLG